jgi:hypothetical protein
MILFDVCVNLFCLCDLVLIVSARCVVHKALCVFIGWDARLETVRGEEGDNCATILSDGGLVLTSLLNYLAKL